MSSVIILVTYLAEELQLQVVVFSRKEEYEVAVAGQLVDIIEYAVRAEEGIDPADGMDEDELGLLFFYEALDAGDDDGLDVEHAVECRYEVLSGDLSFSLQDGIEDTFLLENVGAEVVEIDVDGGDAFFLQSLHQVLYLLWYR